MAKLTVCKVCGNQVAKGAKVCPHCGAKVKKPPIILIVLGVFILIGIIGSALGGGGDEDNLPENASTTPSTTPSIAQSADPEQASTPIINKELDVSDYTKIDADVLFEYGNYMQGEKVVTVITIADATSGFLKANTSNNDSLFFSINCEFEDRDYPKQFEEESTVTIAGEIKEDDSPIGETVVLENCSVIGFGEIADELKAGAEEQRARGEECKAAHEKEEADAIQAAKDEYISQCVTVTYSDVERNPDNYKGTKIVVSGQVVQVSEGFFDSVTLRLNSGGNMWYVTYSRKEGESRILEGDNITCYGECDGVESYTTVIGSQVTIPSLKMKYYN